MKWSPQQDDALVSFKRWWDAGCDGRVFHLFGYAGTGKTTLAIELAQAIDGKTCFAAFTGKAASVMRGKGCTGAKTIHSLIYNTQQQSRLRLIELERELADLLVMEPDNKKRIEKLRADIKTEQINIRQPSFSINEASKVREADLLVVDEVSMVDARIGSDLRYFNVPILVLGDPAQLPPVKGGGYFMTEKPDVMLTEIHRTALDNPVLALATKVRKGEGIQFGNYGDSRVLTSKELERGCSLTYDQVIVGKNATRRNANDAIRMQLGFNETLPMEGDKLVCLKNNHDLGLMNGTLHRVIKSEDTGDEILLRVEAEDDGAIIDEIEAYREPFEGKETPRWSGQRLDEFDYGYAITCHKSQGSEWGNVFIVDESSVFRSDRDRWLYTAITRASNKVMIVR